MGARANRTRRGGARLVALLVLGLAVTLCGVVAIIVVRTGRLRGLFEAPAERARLLAKIHRYEEALKLYERARQQRPRDPKVLRGIAECHKGRGKFGEGFVWAEQAARYDPTPRAHLLAAEIALLAAGAWDPLSPGSPTPRDQSEVWLKKAEEHATAGLQQDPRFGPCHRVLAEVEARRGHLAKAIANVEKAVAVDPDSRATRLLAATLLALNGRPEAALRHVTHLINLLGKAKALTLADGAAYLNALATAARAQAELGRLTEALGCWQKFIERGGDKALGHLGIAGCELERKNFEAVLAEVKRAETHIPPDRPSWLPYYLRGRAYLALKRHEDAVRQLRRASSIAPGKFEAHYFLALALLKTGQRDEAREHFIAALDKEPRFVQARVRLAELFERNGNLPEALECLREGLETTPDAPELSQALAEIASRHGLTDEAETALRGLVRLRPADPGPVSRLAELYARRGELERALALARQALANAPREAKLLALAARAETRLGRFRAAEGRLREAIRVAPDAPEPYLQLAALRTELGDPAGAEETYRAALAAAPKSPELNRAYARFLVEKGANVQARQLLLSLLAENPKDLATYRALVELLLAVGQTDQALRVAERASSAMARDAAAALLLAGTRRRCGRWDLFLSTLDYIANQLDPTNFATYQRLGAHFHEGHFEAAARVGRRALEAHPRRRRQIALDLAIADFFAGRTDQAVEAVRKLASSDRADCEAGFALSLMELAAGAKQPTAPAYREFTLPPIAFGAWTDLLGMSKRAPEKARQVARTVLRAKVYQSAGWPAVAADELEEALELAPDCLMAACLVPLLRERAGQHERAIAAARRAADALPQFPQLELLLADLLTQAGRLDEAATHYDACATDPKTRDAEALIKLGLIRSARGDHEGAVDCWRKLRHDDPRQMPACNNLAWLLGESPRQDLAKALDPARNALAADAQNPAALDTVGWLHYLRVREGLARDTRHELRRALDLLERAVAKVPHRALYHYHLGMALALGGDRGRAEQELRRAIAMDPDGPLRDHAALTLETMEWSEQ